MKKILGILTLLIVVCVATTIANGAFVEAGNLENLMRRAALFGFISIGVAFVIITGGIDLSIGSAMALTGCLLAMFLTVSYEVAGTPYELRELIPTEKTLVLAGDVTGVGKDDRLIYKKSTGKDGHLMIVSVTSRNDGATAVEVRDLIPSSLKSGDKVDVAYMTHMSIPLALLLVMLISLAIGLVHGLLITKVKLQPFVVTLCGLLIYRGMARYLANDQTKGFLTYFEGLKWYAKGKVGSIPVPLIGKISGGAAEKPGDSFFYNLFQPVVEGTGGQWVGIPVPMLMLVIVGVAAAVFLNKTIYGRYLLALGRNEEAARFSGINTNRMVIVAYVICAVLAGFAGILFALDVNSIQPSGHATFYELYAIAAAVLGACSLRGGEGSILGVIIGAAIMRVLYNSITMTAIPNTLEFVFIGVVILIGVIGDEAVKRMAAKRRARSEAQLAEQSAEEPATSS